MKLLKLTRISFSFKNSSLFLNSKVLSFAGQKLVLSSFLENLCPFDLIVLLPLYLVTSSLIWINFTALAESIARDKVS